MSAIERIFVVDDDLDIAALLQSKLSALGYTVEIYNREKGAHEEAKKFDPHLVLLDVMLGDGIGYQVARELRSDPLLFKVPILFQSVIDDQHDITHAFSEGGDGYLTKPYSMKSLSESIKKMQASIEDYERSCVETGFHSVTYLRRQIDHRLFRNEGVALSYVFVDGLTAYQKNRAHDAISHVILNTAREISHTIQSCGFYEVVACHLGSGYFMVMTLLEDKKRFAKCLMDVASMEEKTFHPVKENEIMSKPKQLLITQTDTSDRDYEHATEMFDEVRKLEEVSRKHDRQERKHSGHKAWIG